jgi:flagellar motor switch protein FliG
MSDLSPDGLNPTDAERAAVMIMLLEDEQAASLLGQLDPAELRLLGERMCALGEISPAAIADAIGRFVEKTERMGLIVPDRVGQVRDMMTRAIGEIKTESLMQRIAPEQRTNSLELARWLTPQVLVPLVRDEHPQAIAVLLVQLDADVAAGVLHGLAEEIQPQVVHRVATLGRVSPDALIVLEDMLARRITECHGQAALTMGGPREAADIINAATRALAKAIENEMFKFEHLFVLDEKSMGTLLREVDSDTLIGALKGAPEDKREVFFRAMSSRAADGVRDEIAARGRMKMAEVLEAQKAMITAARRLAAEGVIVFGAGDDDYV